MDNLISKERYNELKTILETQKDSCFTCLAKDFNPQVLISARLPLINNDIPVTDIVVSITIWDMIMNNDSWAAYFDPETRVKKLKEGHLGMFFRMHMWTDGYLPINEQFMKEGEIILMAEEYEIFSLLTVDFR